MFDEIIQRFVFDDYLVDGIDYKGQSFNVYRGGNTCAVARVFVDVDDFVIVLGLTNQGVVYDWFTVEYDELYLPNFLRKYMELMGD